MNSNYDGDFIEICTKDGQEKKAELLAKFEINGLGEYVIYRLDGLAYGAKYKFDGKNTILDTNLSNKEKEILNEMFLKLGGK